MNSLYIVVRKARLLTTPHSITENFTVGQPSLKPRLSSPKYLAQSERHPKTYKRYQWQVILGLVVPLSKVVASCVPLAIPPDQKSNPLAALH